MSWRWLVLSLLTLAVVVSAIGVVYSRHQHRVAFAQLSALERSRDELNIEFDRPIEPDEARAVLIAARAVDAARDKIDQVRVRAQGTLYDISLQRAPARLPGKR